MAWLFLQLKLRLIAGSWRGPGGRARVAGFLLAGGSGLLVMLIGFVTLATRRGSSGATNAAAAAFAALLVGWLVLPVLTCGLDDTLDPARLALLPLRRRTLMTGLFTAALVGIAPVVTTVLLLGAMVEASAGPGSVLVGFVAVAIELALCVTGSRFLVTAMSGLMRSRRGRDLGMMVGGLFAFAVVLLDLLFQTLLARNDLGRLRTGVRGGNEILRWSPPGMLVHAITDATGGHYPLAVAELALGAALVAGFGWLWSVALGRALTATDASSGPARNRVARASRTGRAGWADRSRALAVAGKEFRQLRRDPRRRAGLISLAVPVVVMVPALASAGHGSASLAGPLILTAGVYGGAIAGTQAANQLGWDASAFWLEMLAISRPAQFRASLAGRNLILACTGAAVFSVIFGLVGAISGRWVAAAGGYGLALAGIGASLGIGNVVAVLAPYPIPDRMNAFGGGATGRGCLAALVALGCVAGSALLLIPVLIVIADVHSGWWLLLVGPAYGAVLAWSGRLIGGRVGYARMPEILAVLTRQV